MAKPICLCCLYVPTFNLTNTIKLVISIICRSVNRQLKCHGCDKPRCIQYIQERSGTRRLTVAKQNSTTPCHCTFMKLSVFPHLGSAVEETVTLSLLWCNNRVMVSKHRDTTQTQSQHRGRGTPKVHDSSAVASFATSPKVPVLDLCRDSLC